MYAIYERDETKFEGYEDDEEDLTDLGEAVELFRQLRDEDPEEFERIASLRDGIRAGKRSDEKGTYVFCQAVGYGDVKGEELLQELEVLYSKYRMFETASRPSIRREEDDAPRIVCSEALT